MTPIDIEQDKAGEACVLARTAISIDLALVAYSARSTLIHTLII